MLLYLLKNILWTNIVIVGILLFLSHHSYAQQQHFVIGLEKLNYLPYYQTNVADQKPTGYSIELIELFARKYHYTIQFEIYPVKRLLSYLLAGKIDFKYPDSSNWLPTLKRSHQVHYSNSTIEIIDGILTLEKNRSLLLDEFTQMGSIRGFTPWPYMEAVPLAELNLMKASNMNQLILQLKKERVQGIYVNINVGIDYAAEHFDGLKLYWNSSLPFGRDNFSLSTIKHKEVLEQFNDFMLKYRDQILTLKQKYKLDSF